MPYVNSLEEIFRRDGRKEGIKEGIKEGLLKAVRQALELRFGDEGRTLAPELEALEETALSTVHEALIRGSDLEEVRRVISAARP